MNAPSAVIARVAGGPRTGFGHLRRSWTLASRLVQDAVAVHFVCATPDGAGILAEAGFPVTVEDHPRSLARTLDLLRRPPAPRLCLVDDPDLPAAALSDLSACAPLVCVDDTGEREMPVDLAVNGSAGAQHLVYRGLPWTEYLLGPDYILLRREFTGVPKRLPTALDIRRVLVLTGGGGTGTLSRQIAEVVAEVLPRAVVDVVTGPFADSQPEGEPSDRMTWYRSPQDIRSLMLAADLAVSAGGQTLYELAAAATPTLGVRVTANQSLNLKGLSEAGCLRDIGSPEAPQFRTRLAGTLEELAGDAKTREAMGNRGRRLVDGKGVERVAARIQSLLRETTLVREPRSCPN